MSKAHPQGSKIYLEKIITREKRGAERELLERVKNYYLKMHPNLSSSDIKINNHRITISRIKNASKKEIIDKENEGRSEH